MPRLIRFAPRAAVTALLATCLLTAAGVYALAAALAHRARARRG